MGDPVALLYLRDVGEVQPGDAGLINRASGGVGTFAVQIAKALGAEVTGLLCQSNTLTVGIGTMRRWSPT